MGETELGVWRLNGRLYVEPWPETVGLEVEHGLDLRRAQRESLSLEIAAYSIE
jgi:hypothetical protein